MKVTQPFLSNLVFTPSAVVHSSAEAAVDLRSYAFALGRAGHLPRQAVLSGFHFGSAGAFLNSRVVLGPIKSDDDTVPQHPWGGPFGRRDKPAIPFVPPRNDRGRDQGTGQIPLRIDIGQQQIWEEYEERRRRGEQGPDTGKSGVVKIDYSV